MEVMTEDECVLRPMNCELNKLTMPDGSSMLMQGDTAVIAGVYGPVEAKAQRMMYDKASVETIFSSVKGPPSIEDRLKEAIVKETFETALISALHPGTAICINIQELQDSGGLLACTINAACLALLSSGLPMKFVVGSVSCMISEETGEIIIDPDATQSQKARATFTYAFDGIKKNLVSCHTTGSFSEEELMQTMEKCRQASQLVFRFYRDIVTQYAKRI